jgi:hypothetical protein
MFVAQIIGVNTSITKISAAARPKRPLLFIKRHRQEADRTLLEMATVGLLE